MGNAFFRQNDFNMSTDSVLELLPGVIEAVPMLSSILGSLKTGGLKQMDTDVLRTLTQHMAGAIPGLEGLLTKKE
ncbi:MAG: hypothetical protein GX971_11750 [Firmicutes bacterium]|nr:hypothetical protein [Bacillota bacterium]